jgi:SAM-dependent methyltransferase
MGEFFIIKKRILNLLKDSFKKSDIVLDVGAGQKPYYQKAVNAKIVSLDIKHSKNIHIISDASSLPIKRSKFDGVLCINALYYNKNPFTAIKEISRVLKKNGKLVMMTPFIYPIHDAPNDKYRFTKYGIKEMLNDDFEIKEIKGVGSIFNLPAVMMHSIIKGIPLMHPKSVVLKVLSLLLYPFYIMCQLISILDFLDHSERWSTWYFTVAVKK